MDLFAQLLVNGVVAGSLYALVACSFGLILGTTGTFHFAHGVVYAAGAYGAYFAAGLGLPLWAAAGVGIAGAALLGTLIEVVVYRPLRRIAASPLVILIASLGTLIVLENAIAIGFSTDAKVLEGFPRKGIVLGGVGFTTLHVTMVAVSLVLFLGLLAFLRWTRRGKAIRAVANSPEMAEIVGIDTARVFLLVFALGSAMAAPAAILIMLDRGATPDMGMDAILIAAIAVIVGGIGSVPGAALGALIIGLAQNLGVMKIPSEWQAAIAFGVLLLVVILRPRGLVGKKLRRAEI
ncbi:MAG: branched-chain amino acid ABC transporter permease [Candidatus Rokubacteria bacterium]|nr:branched-chain amino acid ABC transporter permease [Candidatus Rokubacteria bacterium]